MKRTALLSSLLVVAGALGLVAPASADDYPTRPIRIIVPYPAGGVVDLVARSIADKVSEILKVPVIVEDKPGGNSVIGTETAAKAPPDGYTLLMASTSHVVNGSLYKSLPYDALTAFKGVIYVADAPNIVTVPASLPVHSMKEFVAYAKARPGELNYGNPGVGSTNHLSAELLQQVTGIKLVGVGYKGQPEVLPALLDGSISLMYATPTVVMSQVRLGRLRALAVTSGSRLQTLPDVPTLKEAGFEETLVPPWFGLVVRSETPDDVVRRINEAANKALASDACIERLQKIYAIPAGGTAKDFDAFLKGQSDRWARLVKEAHISTQ